MGKIKRKKEKEIIKKEIKKESLEKRNQYVKVLFFAQAKEIVNKSELNIKIPRKSTVKDLIDILYTNYPGLKKIGFSIALNEEYLSDYNVVIKSKDVVAIIPPVSGG